MGGGLIMSTPDNGYQERMRLQNLVESQAAEIDRLKELVSVLEENYMHLENEALILAEGGMR